MSIKIWHQCGHNSNWNHESFLEDKCGDGLIISPVHRNMDTIEKDKDEVNSSSLFDPQYYLPSSQKKKLKTYDFFPDVIAGGFDTDDYASVATDSARKCLEFQIQQGFEALVIPARYHEQMVPDLIEKQKAYTTTPFLRALDELKPDKKVFLTIPLTSAIIKDAQYRTSILNWITSYPEVHGIYLIASHDEKGSKQITEENFLTNYMELTRALIEADLEVIVGYLNTEGLLFTLVENCQITFGAYENTRMFSLSKFVESDEVIRGPKSRIYIPGLLQWIQWSHAQQLSKELPELWNEIYTPTTYGDDTIKQTTEPHFTQPGLYKHHFLAFETQVQELAALPIAKRYKVLKAKIERAIKLNDIIEEEGFSFDKYGKSFHLQPWLDTINSFYRHHLKN